MMKTMMVLDSQSSAMIVLSGRNSNAMTTASYKKSRCRVRLLRRLRSNFYWPKVSAVGRSIVTTEKKNQRSETQFSKKKNGALFIPKVKSPRLAVGFELRRSILSVQSTRPPNINNITSRTRDRGHILHIRPSPNHDGRTHQQQRRRRQRR